MKTLKTFSIALFLLLLFCTTTLMSQISSYNVSPKVFYRETFNWRNTADPKGWTAPPGYYLEDQTDNGFNWHWWPNDSLVSSWTAEPPFQSTSKNDGHLCLFAALYNNYKNLPDCKPINNSIVFPAIDCSNHSSVILQFQTSFMNLGFQGNLTGSWRNTIEVSPDNGVHWTQFNAGFGCSNKNKPNDVAPGQPAMFQENISEVAAGSPMVRIRVNWINFFGLYYWIIDDFQLSEAQPNDLRLDKIDFQWNDLDGTIDESVSYMIPFSQIGKGYSFDSFKSWVTNMGANEATNVVFDVNIKMGDVPVFHNSLELPSLMPGYKDSLSLIGKYEPRQKGTYNIQFKWSQDNQDDFPLDNEKTFVFNISDSVYNRAGDQPDYSYTGGSGNSSKDEYNLYANVNHVVASVFPIYQDCEIDGLSAYIMGGLADGLIDFGATVYSPDWSSGVLSTQILLKSDRLDLDSSMFDKWIYLPFTKDGESEFVKAGTRLWAGLEYSNWHSNDAIRRDKGLALGASRQSPYHEIMAMGRTRSSWTTLFQRNLMIRLHLHNTVSTTDPADQESFTVGQNYPNPFKDHTGFYYSLGVDAKVILEVTDITGQMVLKREEGVKSAGRHRLDILNTGLSPGIYFYTVHAGEYSVTKKMIVFQEY
ncbi:MAG: T9SS type A sorting domain-containing protein [Bacteroidales bacterium]